MRSQRSTTSPRIDKILAFRRGPTISSSTDRIRRVAEQVPAVSDVLDTIERQNWERLAGLLHPEIHWTTAAEDELHGPREVIARLARDPPPAPPSFHEMRNGLMYRWIDCPG
jgi:hypothetical protein